MNNRIPSSGPRNIYLFGIGAVLVLLLGAWEGHPFVLLAIYATVVSAWLLWIHGRLARWLRVGGTAPQAGIAGEIASRITRRIQRERRRTRRVGNLARLYRNAVLNLPDGIVVLDDEHRIQWLNNSAGRLLNLELARDRGEKIGNLVRHPELESHLSQKTTDKPLIIESAMGGRLVGLEIARIASNSCMLVARDVTDSATSEMARREFVANASHELRSPLTVIRGYLDALDTDQSLDPEWQEPVAEMGRQATRMSSLLNDLMDLSRLDKLYRSAEFNVIPMAAVVQRVVDDVLVSSRLSRRIAVDVDHSVNLLGERPEVVLILTNLVGNAVRYTPDNGQIDVRWFSDETAGYLEVEDNGIGIAEEDIPRLTERFYRVDKGRSREQGGTGLGLAIVKKALARHGASLEISSQVDRGSVFTCKFPESRLVVASGFNRDTAAG